MCFLISLDDWMLMKGNLSESIPFFSLSCILCTVCSPLPWLQVCVCESSLQCVCQAVSFPVSSSLVLKRWWLVKKSYLLKTDPAVASSKKYFYVEQKTCRNLQRWRCLKELGTKRKSVSDSFKVNVASPRRTSFWPYNVKDIVGEVRTGVLLFLIPLLHPIW